MSDEELLKHYGLDEGFGKHFLDALNHATDINANSTPEPQIYAPEDNPYRVPLNKGSKSNFYSVFFLNILPHKGHLP